MLSEWVVAIDRLWSSPTWIEGLALLLLAVPLLLASRIVRRAGYSPWWVLLLLVPLVNLVALWLFAYARWPAVDSRTPPSG